ncbi:hypothetical protein [Aureibacter tunicatorum]|uniref:Acyl carrier protein n=1 Tax=Aureibacter tunicatorum TaxID=866807 RepID=A0AAE4BRK9_9BACT|nr:hypothetical protein [Aureibacter tunicatorum]MDR6238781.1 hypothetical protein [Aureibacter tunicatorum]BDD05289.1 hypothetical protein AUTU_27720 [Aureibacter tunicatorum]
MGLDSIELLMSVEDKFGIRFSKEEAERIITVRNFANETFQKLSVADHHTSVQQIVFYRLRKAFIQIGNDKKMVEPNSLVSHLLSKENLESDWNQIEKLTEFKLPQLNNWDFNDEEVKGKEYKVWGITYYTDISLFPQPVSRVTIKKLVDWVISLNYAQLINPQEITSEYEVQRIIVGLLDELCGVDVNAQKLDHEIVKDFGIE